jgi:S1-C subfamily serine protease
MATGGLLLERLPDADRQSSGLSSEQMALRAKHVGEYDEHAVAKNAGFRKGDVIVAVDEQKDLMTETQLIAYVLDHKQRGERLKFEVLRGHKRLELSFAAQ